MERRRFLRSLLASATAPLVISRPTWAKGSAADRIRIGLIGSGRQGRNLAKQAFFRGFEQNARLVALCDVDQLRLQRADAEIRADYQETRGEPWTEPFDHHTDFREVLDRSDIDAVIVATPEFRHADIATAVAEAGKPIYLEKPLTNGIDEGARLVRATDRAGIVTQVGLQQRSSIYFRRVCEAARNGRIGRIERVKVFLPQDSGSAYFEPMPVPETFDYRRWLGPMEWRPYTEAMVHPQKKFWRPGWMQVADFAHGMITNWGAHMVDIAHWGLGKGQELPVWYRASAQFPDRGIYTVHTAMEAEARYADGTVLTIETLPEIEVPEEERANDRYHPRVEFYGSDGWMLCRRGAFSASDRELLQPMENPQVKLYQSDDHMANFIESVRNNTPAAVPVAEAHLGNVICVATHVAMRTEEELHWDNADQRFVDNSRANQIKG